MSKGRLEAVSDDVIAIITLSTPGRLISSMLAWRFCGRSRTGALSGWYPNQERSEKSYCFPCIDPRYQGCSFDFSMAYLSEIV